MARGKRGIPAHTAEILERYGLDPREVLWDCHGTWILLHRWVELIGIKAGVKLSPPTIIHQDIGKKEVVILVEGHLGDNSTWSFGEAAPNNNKNAYTFAMAEKRAKDRVIMKLVGLAGHVYTDQDAAEIKDGKAVWEVPAQRTAPAVQQPAEPYEEMLEKAPDMTVLAEVAAKIASDEKLSSSAKNRLRSIYAQAESNLKEAQ